MLSKSDANSFRPILLDLIIWPDISPLLACDVESGTLSLCSSPLVFLFSAGCQAVLSLWLDSWTLSQDGGAQLGPFYFSDEVQAPAVAHYSPLCAW